MTRAAAHASGGPAAIFPGKPGRAPHDARMNEAPVPAAAPELRDFSDRLPPVLVKELRQGLRTRMFVISFLVLHGLLVIGSVEGGSGSGFFWTCLCIMLVAVLPLRNTSALSEERQANTLDTLLLTQLTPWRIVWGKWSATVALVLLTAVSALPYLLVRYLKGGSNIVQEAAVLGGVVLISGALTAVLTGLSTLTTGVARHLSGVVLIFAAYTLGCRPLLRTMEYGIVSPDIAATMLTVTLWATFFSLSHAAAALAPAAMNLTTSRRLTTLAAIGLVTAICVFMTPPDGRSASDALLLILMVSCMVEMGDQSSRHPCVGASFARHGALGKLAALFLHPGWASGVLFCAALWLGSFVVLRLDLSRAVVANFAALCFFPVCAGAPLLSRGRSGTVVMLLGVALAHLFWILAEVPPEGEFIARVLPSLDRRHDFPLSAALVWVGLALAIAIVPLAALLRRISRESNL